MWLQVKHQAAAECAKNCSLCKCDPCVCADDNTQPKAADAASGTKAK
jgi:predicted house-cleaning NTP pyrophosphatase (Maf/HAM1 superfamily)